MKKIDEVSKMKIVDVLNTLMQSCREGESGEWDSGSDKTGFTDMISYIELVADLIGVELSVAQCEFCATEMRVVMVPDDVGKGLHEEYECPNCQNTMEKD